MTHVKSLVYLVVVVVHSFNPSTRGAEENRVLRACSQLCLHSESRGRTGRQEGKRKREACLFFIIY